MARIALLVAVIGCALSAQVATDGLRMFGLNAGTTTQLMDTSLGTVHTWTSTYPAGLGTRLDERGRLWRSGRVAAGPGIGGQGGVVQRFSLSGALEWEFHMHDATRWSHHDLEILPNGNVLILVWDSLSVAAASALGRNPALILGATVRLDSILEVMPTGPTSGSVVWEWHVKDHLIQSFSAAVANYGVIAQHPELVDVNFPALAGQASDINHLNGLDYDAVHDWILVSSHNQSEIWIIDHSTTTAQAAGHAGGLRGHGGDLLYRWGNPQAHGAGTAANQQLYGQHNPQLILAGRPGAGHVTVFNNNAPGGSRVHELVLPMDANGGFTMTPGVATLPAAPLWTYAAAGFNSTNISGAERLPSGNTLICSGAQARVFEVTPAGATVWQYQTTGQIFHAHFVDRALWASGTSITLAQGGSINFDLILGAPHAGESHLIAASATGTTPGIGLGAFTLPLNPDPLTSFCLDNANSAMLVNTLGVLNAQGRAQASLALPALPGLPGALTTHWAALIWNPSTMAIRAASVAVPVTIIP